ncbi:acetate/propionate family kinase [Levilactobacillus yiduensis]|uniref:acetate/propionate family kinase n=1 Tax=Levilactobacillus yiduensis TaxID=2953880 RepID=UPI000EF2E42C|nr:acetate kinase [Levilactobacillus yiduensis]AYM02417.1 acetate kinase [Levilactobacillus brevis]
MPKILSVNAGSSSLKFKLYAMPAEDVVISGLVDRIGHSDCIFTYDYQGAKHKSVQAVQNHTEAVQLVTDALLDSGAIQDKSEIVGIGHRVAHGGRDYTQSTEITPVVQQKIADLADMSPLHNPVNLLGIEAFEKLLPDAREVAVFDTSFHSTIPSKAYMYALPFEYYEKYGIRRYGFHGQSHQYIYSEVNRRYDQDFSRKIISCHLGNGASVCAIKDGKSVNTSMGFTPLAGLVMGTRSGDVDPNILPFLAEKEDLSAADIRQVLNHKSGLLGLSGVSNDVRDVLKAEADGNKRAELALQVYVHQIQTYIAAYTADLGGLQTLVFTAGVGEHSAPIRERVCADLEYLGVKIDADANRDNDLDISAADSRVKVLVIPTNEELVIARETEKVVDS